MARAYEVPRGPQHRPLYSGLRRQGNPVLVRRATNAIVVGLTTLAIAFEVGCTPAKSIAPTGAAAPRSSGRKAPDPAEITEIKVEFHPGGPPLPGDMQSNIHLRRPASGAIGSLEYDRLARWLVSHGYFDLQDRYGGSEPSDCTAVLLIVVFGDQKKSVMNYCGGGDEQTWEFRNDDSRRGFRFRPNECESPAVRNLGTIMAEGGDAMGEAGLRVRKLRRIVLFVGGIMPGHETTSRS